MAMASSNLLRRVRASAWVRRSCISPGSTLLTGVEGGSVASGEAAGCSVCAGAVAPATVAVGAGVSGASRRGRKMMASTMAIMATAAKTRPPISCGLGRLAGAWVGGGASIISVAATACTAGGTPFMATVSWSARPGTW